MTLRGRSPGEPAHIVLAQTYQPVTQTWIVEASPHGRTDALNRHRVEVYGAFPSYFRNGGGVRAGDGDTRFLCFEQRKTESLVQRREQKEFRAAEYRIDILGGYLTEKSYS